MSEDENDNTEGVISQDAKLKVHHVKRQRDGAIT